MADDTNTSQNYDVIVLGAGAAGLMCALTAGQRGRRVLVLEKSNKVGKKILMSGGGRCNFTNLAVDSDNFISGNPHFCKSALSRYSQWDFLAMVKKHGIDYEERKHGQLFCIHTARDILNMLLKECKASAVEIRTECEVGEIKTLSSPEQQARYSLALSQSSKSDREIALTCDAVVVATGALSIPTLGGSGMGYEYAGEIGLTLTDRRAGLVPFMFSDSMKPLCERLTGLATEVEVSCNGQSFTENMLFTHRGISGPAILQISNYWYPGDELLVNILPGVQIDEWLLKLKDSHGKSLLRSALRKKLPKALVTELQALWWPELAESALAQFSDKKLREIGKHLNGWQLKPSATEGYRTAEVTLGGVDTKGLSSRTMEVKNQPGLYFIGEVVDVTGHLGGFNFQWAWSSGYSAGMFV